MKNLENVKFTKQKKVEFDILFTKQKIWVLIMNE